MFIGYLGAQLFYKLPGYSSSAISLESTLKEKHKAKLANVKLSAGKIDSR